MNPIETPPTAVPFICTLYLYNRCYINPNFNSFKSVRTHLFTMRFVLILACLAWLYVAYTQGQEACRGRVLNGKAKVPYLYELDLNFRKHLQSG